MESDQSVRNHARRRSASAAQLLVGESSGGSSSLQSPHYNADLDESHDTHPGRRDSSASNGESSSDWELEDMDEDENLDDDEETGLTDKDKKRKRRRKRRNTLLDQRVMQDTQNRKIEEDIAQKSFSRNVLINAVLIGLWYGFSISISVFNKWVLSKKSVDFHFPLFFTSCHMVIQFGLASLVLYLNPSFRPDAVESGEPRYTQIGQPAEEQPVQQKKTVMTKMFYLTRIAPCGAATGLDIGLGNMSLMFISLTFFTMCKSSVLGFVLIFAFLFRLEKPSWKLAAVIVTMTIGVVLMVAGETAFNILGFVLIMSASFFSGFRWSLTQILLLRNPATSNPFSSIFFLAPVMFFTLIVIAFPVEGLSNFIAGLHRLAEARGTFLAICIMIFPGFLAFMMTAAEFALLKRTSVVTLSVCGIFKEVLTISTGAIVFGDELTPINVSGLLVTIASIAAYNYMKVRKMRQDIKRDAAQQVAADSSVLDINDRQKDRDGDGDGAYRNSTSGLIRNSLSVQTDAADRVRKGGAAEGERASPMKRPEDHE